MKKFFVFFMAMMLPVCMLSSCDDLDEILNDDDDEIWIHNETSYDWRSTKVVFVTESGKKKKSVSVGTVERLNSVDVNKASNYFYVLFNDERGKEHQTERYYVKNDYSISVKTIVR